MTDDLIARPGDPSLDCHLTGLRLAEVVESPMGDYDAEAVLSFDATEAAGFMGHDGELPSPLGVEVAFGFRVTGPGSQYLSKYVKTVLRWWRDTGAPIELTSAPGKWTLLRSDYREVAVPRKVPAGAGRESG